ncbi:MAG TPA: amino acid permease [Vicinamibacterales bacterium]|nr:amino acid permease [Vicinamibacterales bacterium]
MPSGSAAAAVAAPDRALIQAIGLPTAVLFVIGSVVGSGIFMTTGIMAEALPSTTLLLVAWTCGGVLALCGGLTYAEMGAMFPRSGGVYVFLREAWGPMVGFLYGWAALLVVVSGGIAAVAVGFSEWVSYFIEPLSPRNILWSIPTGAGVWRISAGQLVAASCIAVLGAINYVGVRSGNFVNAVMTAAKVAGLAMLPLLALIIRRVEPAFTPVVPDVPRPAAAFGVAMIAVLWTYEAWYFVTYATGEIKDPRRNLPRALLYGILSLTTIYLSVNLAYFYALRLDEIQGVVRIAQHAATALVGDAGATFIAITVVISTFGCNVAAILAGSRLLYAMSSDGLFFRATGTVHPRYRTPHVAIVAVTAWSIVLALSGRYDQLFTYVMFASILFSVAGGLALFRLRRTKPDHPRPYRAWGYPVVPALFIAGSVAFVLNTLVERPMESLAGLGLLALGLPAYWYWSRSQTPELKVGPRP